MKNKEIFDVARITGGGHDEKLARFSFIALNCDVSLIFPPKTGSHFSNRPSVSGLSLPLSITVRGECEAPAVEVGDPQLGGQRGRPLRLPLCLKRFCPVFLLALAEEEENWG